jgi:L-threonylcarbamoyladenylate synthase
MPISSALRRLDMGRIIEVDSDRPEREAIEEAARILRAGELVAFPTETVYGLGAHALDPVAVERIYEAKGRPATNPLIVHVATLDAARALSSSWSSTAERLASHFWPGPLTLVVPRADCVPASVSAGMDTVALRMPAHPVALALLLASGLPLAAPSANRYMEVSPTTAAHVQKSLGERVGLILDAGSTRVGIESTVVAVEDDRVEILRPGMITREDLEQVVPNVIADIPQIIEETQARPSPGLARRHYAPRARVLLAQTQANIEASARSLGETPPVGAILVGEGKLPSVPERSCIRLPADPNEYARHLYGALHALDEQGLQVIFVEMPPREGRWKGIWDRLERAAEPPENP